MMVAIHLNIDGLTKKGKQMKVIEPRILQIELLPEDVYKIRDSIRNSTINERNVANTVNLIKDLIKEAFELGRSYPFSDQKDA